MPTPLRCDPKLFEKDLSGYVIIVTGANSGIGLETTRQLAKQNATVILACRNEAKAKAAIDDIGLPDKTIFLALDLSSLESIRNFVKSFNSQYDRLDVLVNNAGIMACPYGKTKDGFESQFGCNHLGHFLLFQLLAQVLVKTSKDTGKPSRFISVSSVAASMMSMGNTDYAKIDFDDLQFDSKEYDKAAAYQQSKLSNYLCAWEASKKYDASEILSFSLHPGWVRSNLDQHIIPMNFIGNMMRKLFQYSGNMISAVDGAQTTLHCVLNDTADMENGAFYSQFGIYKDAHARDGGWPITLPNPNATPEVSSKLWEVSEKLVDLKN
mmetsp:Transcript_2681/g.3793  ORF Transcript_2681/g.3793 Transcript_2681/m.3793 type:complete len:324 (-) Transcript_2681:119-1090(-)|eukprot:CAMPEP_0184863612 /NCGR_PEP_ID=MMETSP0580-20130426/11879_1 /TAXON_ID=1118495 /ORGANISM="Dactyliosolen fragilissimus" /LENGTH=323 /DNA_ID=CAMNT_0027362051 /DNA_START=33 /DNA_END=1004 /DNA_ORIENTATION=-